ncbi:MAG: hypothetical protein IJ482_06210 [Alphaproteobacteria bacterium]|nr:hypothetical protein [Alphaproteobacteria bacterium]
MALSSKILKEKARCLLSSFELYHFQNRLEYGRGLNLLFEFCDYVNEMPDWKLLAELDSDDKSDAANFRRMINSEIDYWLNDLLKTICF